MNQRGPDGSFIPQIISLPPIPTPFGTPKGFEHPSAWNSFLLSEERYKLYKEIDDFVKGNVQEGTNAGFVPSAPHGMGKTAIGLLLACYAFVNSHFLIYIVSTFYSFYNS